MSWTATTKKSKTKKYLRANPHTQTKPNGEPFNQRQHRLRRRLRVFTVSLSRSLSLSFSFVK